MRRRAALKTIFSCAAALVVRGLASEEEFAADPLLENEVEPDERYAMARVAEDYRRKFSAPGLSVVIVRDGELRYREAFGFTGRDSREPLTTSSLFRIASVSKPITSAAIFGLIETGRLRGDDTVFGERGILGTKYGKQPYGQGIEQITIDHLLTHTPGDWGPWHAIANLLRRVSPYWRSPRQAVYQPFAFTIVLWARTAKKRREQSASAPLLSHFSLLVS